MKKFAITLASVAALSLGACAESDTVEDDTAMTDEMAADQMAVEDTASGTIVEVAQGNPDFSTLVEAVTAADLGETLSGGEYTVFAPTNAAFDALPDGTLETLTTEDTDQLGSILTYHVVEGMTDAAALTAAIEAAGEEGYTITTVNGAELTAMMEGGNVVLRDAAGNTATVTQTDIDASNGVIHVIDTVLMPE
ncbi:fasciclin domain-containing protein [Alteriqipengyuania lutimaris]|uniref:Fasciclin domain-containing protein n=1 Tax=Alteriqipengyuania lutimaris TaxID=1538146 RepID=A0A395LH31_9SPHN|nr:fasciclin domain-containing protein [Alteriqipengyuania lutimaris]MBB3034962.1 putative surface protein with fasciclin (FAS1) repeats [Alteriqipengyuania lutimaris]RDS76218.1 fasciclin domain-containing protein [Alteriqipengyuania lutimaris]